MSQNRRYLIIAIVIMVIITLWVSRGQDTQVEQTALPSNGMMEGGQPADSAAMPPEAAPAMENMDASAPAVDGSMPDSAADASEIDGVPQGTEVSGEAPDAASDVPAPASTDAAPEEQPMLPNVGGGQ